MQVRNTADSGYVSVLSLILCMYLYSTSQTLNAHKVTLGNMVSKTFIIMMMLAIFVLPQATVAQRDVDLDQPPSSLDETIVTQQNTQPKPQIIQRNIETTQSLKHSDTVAAGTLSNKIDPTTIWSYAKGGGR